MEFSKYKHLAKFARRIVEQDHIPTLSKLYNYVGVTFIPDFKQALRAAKDMSKTQHVVIATHLSLEHYQTKEKQTHAVSLWFNQDGNGFLFDSNGEVNEEGVWEVDRYKDYATIRSVFGIRTSMRKGPQYYCPDTPGYIHHGAYCEFYQVLLMEKWFKHLANKHCNVEHFPAKHFGWMEEVDMAQYSKEVLEKVFGDI